MAGLYGPGVYRADRDWGLGFGGGGGGVEEAVLWAGPGHCLPVAEHLRLAGEEWAAAVSQVHCRRELWGGSRTEADGLSAVADWGCGEWAGTGFAGAVSAGWFAGYLADSVDDDAALDRRGEL